MNVDTVRQVSALGEKIIYGDATQREVLLHAGAEEAEGLIISSSSAPAGEIVEVARAINPNLRILMSVTDFDTYDDELTQLANKGAAPTDINQERYKGIPFEVLTQWPEGLMVATICDSGMNGNLFAAVNLQNDENVIQIDKWANASELYFFKMLMKADTQIGFGEEFIALDWRVDGAFKPTVEG